MKKAYLLILSVILCSNSYGQQSNDLCDSLVTREIDEMEGSISYHYTYPSLGNVLLEPYKLIIPRKKVSWSFINFQVYDSSPRYTEENLYIKFENGKIIRYDGKKIKCKYVGNGRYSYSTDLEINEELFKYLSTEKILKITLGIITEDVPVETSEKLIKGINCIYNKQ